MHEIEYWDGWLEDDSKAPHEAISEAIKNAEDLLVALQKLRPESLREVSEEIDRQVGEALKQYLEDATLFSTRTHGVIELSLHDKVVKQLPIIEIAKDVSELGSGNDIADKEAWARVFDEAAKIIRDSIQQEGNP